MIWLSRSRWLFIQRTLPIFKQIDSGAIGPDWALSMEPREVEPVEETGMDEIIVLNVGSISSYSGSDQITGGGNRCGRIFLPNLTALQSTQLGKGLVMREVCL